ncbi:MAG: 3D domain-containing protein, partial [Candidatus Saganbacteria bacterium]|nr:3D domain-containing protein [Candidatus Saganbacteria bacterium]
LIPVLSAAKQGELKHSYRVVKSGIVMATAYNSLAAQTDSTPWITAAGTRCREGVIASNFLPFGTKVMIDGFGSQIFTVEDRMNRRYKKRIDIWFRSYKDARQFGIRKIKYYVLDT